MKLDIFDFGESEDEALSQALTYLRMRKDSLDRALVYVEKRVPIDAPAHRFPGRLEYTLSLHYKNGGTLLVGMLQREPGGQFEFHS